MARAIPVLVVLFLLAPAWADDAEDGGGTRIGRLQAETASRLDALAPEVRRRRATGRYAEADDLETAMARLRCALRGELAPPPGDLPEVHVVAFERGAPGTFGGLPRGNAVVEIECPGRPLVLVLGSANAMHWDLRLGEGVEVTEVWTCGDARHWVRGVGWDQVKRLGEDFAWRREDPGFARMEAAIAKAVGLGITTFQGAEEPGNKPLRLAPDNEEWRVQQIHAEAAQLYWDALRGERAEAAARVSALRFTAAWPYADEGQHGFASYGPFTPLGPALDDHERLPAEMVRARAILRDERGGGLYAIDAGGLLHCDGTTRRCTRLRVPDDSWPRPRDPRGLALDTRRRRVLMATRDGAGYLYAFDLDQREWSVLGDMDHVDVAGLCYDGRADRIWCVGYDTGGGMTIHGIAPDGTWTGETALAVRRPDEGRRPVQLRAIEGRVVLLQAPVPDPRRPGARVVWAAVAEPGSGKVLFETVQRPYASASPLAPGERESLWAGMVGEQEGHTVRRLADGGDETVAFLRERLLEGDRAPTLDLVTWVRRLADERPAVRQQAQVLLQGLGREAQEALSAAIDEATDPETRIRLRSALHHVREAAVRELRRARCAVDVLASIDTPASLALLEELARQGGEVGLRARQAVLALRIPP